MGQSDYRWRVLRTIMFCIVFSMLVVPVWGATELDDYVRRADDAYGWKVVSQRRTADKLWLTELELTSQRWQQGTWKHRLFVVVPEEMKPTDAMVMYISASGNAAAEVEAMRQAALLLQAPTAVLMDVPNQPLYGGLREDALIAYTFARYMETGDADWPLLLPMTKSAVKAMDALQQFVKENHAVNVERFVLSGASKRGWTTWLAGAVDERVIGIAPAVYNNLNLPAQMALQERTFAGGASPKIRDYTTMGFHQIVQTEAGMELSRIVDPFAYVERLTMPKMLMHGTNDPYWPVDALNVYWDDLPGETIVVNFPNGGHDLGDIPRIITMLGAFFAHVTERPVLPKLNWNMNRDNGRLTVKKPPLSRHASMWIAISSSRDFTAALWSKHEAKAGADGWYVEPMSLPNTYVAYYVEVEVGLTAADTLVLNTPIFVLEPDGTVR